jgi:hypothetical protein
MVSITRNGFPLNGYGFPLNGNEFSIIGGFHKWLVGVDIKKFKCLVNNTKIIKLGLNVILVTRILFTKRAHWKKISEFS